MITKKKKNNMKIYNWNDEFSKEVCSWKYPTPYSIYNLPSYKEMQMSSLGFADSQKKQNFKGVVSENRLIGFFNLINETDEVFMGIGVCPEQCSKGFGYEIILLAILESNQIYGNKPIYLEVREWNTRAINCYLKAGFKVEDKVKLNTYTGEGEFIHMIYEFV